MEWVHSFNTMEIVLEPINVKICHLLGYKNVIQGDASDPKTWDKLIKLLNKKANKMKFDHIIMNPPYSRNLHLKILNEAIKHSDDIVNISPIRWLQDPLAEYKQNSDFNKFKEIRAHINTIDIINSDTANRLFNICWCDLGIYHITNIETNKSFFNHPSFVYKILSKRDKSIMNIATREGYTGNYEGIFGVINSHYGDMSCFVKNDYKLFCTARYTNVNKVIFFNSDNERLNMFKYLTSKIMLAYAKAIRINQRVPWQFVPVLPTYEHEWTDKDLYKYFELTSDEIKFIESTFK